MGPTERLLGVELEHFLLQLNEAGLKSIEAHRSDVAVADVGHSATSVVCSSAAARLASSSSLKMLIS